MNPALIVRKCCSTANPSDGGSVALSQKSGALFSVQEDRTRVRGRLNSTYGSTIMLKDGLIINALFVKQVFCV